jgi:hypothetical protein
MWSLQPRSGCSWKEKPERNKLMKDTFRLFTVGPMLWRVVAFLMMPSAVYGQDCFFCKEREWAVVGGYTVQRQNAWEIGMIRTSLEKPTSGEKTDGQFILRFFRYSFSTVGAEVVVSPELELFPKIGIGYNGIIYNLGLNLTAYTSSFEKLYPALAPEAGFSFWGMLHVNYGYTFFLSNSDHRYRENTHRLSLRLIYFYESWK